MTVYDFVYLCIEPSFMTVELYSLESGTVWAGPGDEIPEDFLECEICTYDVPTEANRITLNIE